MGIHRPQSAAAVASPYLIEAEPELKAIPGLDEAEAAVEEAERHERKLALGLQTVEVDRIRAENALGHIAERISGAPSQADLDERAAANAVLANIEPRRSALEDAITKAKQKTKAARDKATGLKKKEIERRGRLAYAASETARLRGDAERAAWHAECNRLSGLYTKANQTSDKTVDADLDALSEFA